MSYDDIEDKNLPDSEELRDIIVDALEDIKAKDITVIDTSEKTILFKKLVIATGNSGAQVKAMGRNVLAKLGERGLKGLHSEGFQNGEWVLVDAEEVVVHVMLPQIRDYYKLEEIWV